MSEKKYALVTGGGRGIGRGIALRLGKEGYNVALTYRSSKEGALEVRNRLLDMGSDTLIFCADMSLLEDIGTVFDGYEKHYPYLDLLVNNAGVTLGSPFLETSPELFDTVVNTDLRGVFFMAQRAAKYMINRGCEGSIINIASNQGSANFKNHSVYGSIKAALIKLTKHMALELAPYNIRVNTISPGLVDVSGLDHIKDRHRKKFETVIPLGSWACPEQIAGIAVFLASDDAVYITGEEIIADGGAKLPVMMDLPADFIPDTVKRAESILVKNRRNIIEENNKNSKNI
ncbi:MAG: SDR family oxidoreductase [Oscillospiraceae bacterium]|nr:SDR family oxidoreductase [Oscillospiraceae bacterium]